MNRVFNKRWDEMTEDEQRAHDGKMVDYHARHTESKREERATARMTQSIHHPHYMIPGPLWPDAARQEWIDGWQQRAGGIFKLPDTQFGQEGYLAHAGHAAGELKLPPDLAEILGGPNEL